MKAKKGRQIKSDGWNKKEEEEEEEGRPSRESLERACSQTEKQTGVAPPAAAAIHVQSQIDGRHIGEEKDEEDEEEQISYGWWLVSNFGNDGKRQQPRRRMLRKKENTNEIIHPSIYQFHQSYRTHFLLSCRNFG